MCVGKGFWMSALNWNFSPHLSYLAWLIIPVLSLPHSLQGLSVSMSWDVDRFWGEEL